MPYWDLQAVWCIALKTGWLTGMETTSSLEKTGQLSSPWVVSVAGAQDQLGGEIWGGATRRAPRSQEQHRDRFVLSSFGLAAPSVRGAGSCMVTPVCHGFCPRNHVLQDLLVYWQPAYDLTSPFLLFLVGCMFVLGLAGCLGRPFQDERFYASLRLERGLLYLAVCAVCLQRFMGWGLRYRAGNGEAEL